MKKLNYGCGRDYREGWVNADINPKIRTDIILPPVITTPFADNEFDQILLDNVLEHIPKSDLFAFMDEIWRIVRPGGIVEIYVPHFSSVFAWANLSHQSAFAVGALDCLRLGGGENTEERYGCAVFDIVKEDLLFFGHNIRKLPFLSRLPVNWIFNFNWFWKKAMERFQIFGFDELYYQLKAVKP